MALADHVHAPLPALVDDDRVGGRGAAEFGVTGGTGSRLRRRQFLRVADVVGLGRDDLRFGHLDESELRSVERDLHVGLLRRRASLLVKRGIDIAGAALALFVLFPLLSMVAVAIRLTTPGPVFYSQLRLGLHGRSFRIYKFRTLYSDRCDEAGLIQTVPGDDRITPLGRLLRRTNIDELPQLWNVLKGDMSLVGPRPHAIGMHAGGMAYEQLVLAYPMRCLVKPGITGYAQLRGYRGPTKDPIRARMRILCDLEYIRRFSIMFDLKIMILTVWRELRGGTGG